MALLQRWEPVERFVRVSSTGWTDGNFSAFALADGSVLGQTNVVVDPRCLGNSLPSHRGQVEDWTREVAALCAGNPVAMFAVSQAFVGPLLQILGQRGGGFHLHGATGFPLVLVETAASVWHAPARVDQWTLPAGSLVDLALSRSDQVLSLKGMDHVPARQLAKAFSVLAGGRATGRAAAASSHPATPRSAVLSCGDVSLRDHLAGTAGRHLEQGVILVDIGLDAAATDLLPALHASSGPDELATRLARAANEFHGTAGRAFVERLIKNQNQYPEIRRLFERAVNDFRNKLGTGNSARAQHFTERFALVALAGMLATKYGLTGWTFKAVYDAVADIAQLAKGQLEPGVSAKSTAALARVRAHFDAHSRTRFCNLSTDEGQAGDGWFDRNAVYFRPETWNAIHGESDAVETAQCLCHIGALRTNASGALTFRMPRSVAGRPRAYAVLRSALETGHA